MVFTAGRAATGARTVWPQDMISCKLVGRWRQVDTTPLQRYPHLITVLAKL